MGPAVRDWQLYGAQFSKFSHGCTAGASKVSHCAAWTSKTGSKLMVSDALKWRPWHVQAFCWLCGAATGMSHTWTEISGHSCGRYKEDVDRRIGEAQRNVKRYMHYYTRWCAAPHAVTTPDWSPQYWGGACQSQGARIWPAQIDIEKLRLGSSEH